MAADFNDCKITLYFGYFVICEFIIGSIIYIYEGFVM